MVQREFGGLFKPQDDTGSTAQDGNTQSGDVTQDPKEGEGEPKPEAEAETATGGKRRPGKPAQRPVGRTDANRRVVPVASLLPRMDWNPRHSVYANDASLEALAVNIGMNGVLKAIPVLKANTEGMMPLLGGHRRMAAIDLLRQFLDGTAKPKDGKLPEGLKVPEEVPVDIMDVATASEELFRAFLDNSGEPMAPIERAHLWARILEQEPELTVGQLAQRAGKSRIVVSDDLALLKLPAPVMEGIKEGAISAHSAIQLLRKVGDTNMEIAYQEAVELAKEKGSETITAAIYQQIPTFTAAVTSGEKIAKGPKAKAGSKRQQKLAKRGKSTVKKLKAPGTPKAIPDDIDTVAIVKALVTYGETIIDLSTGIGRTTKGSEARSKFLEFVRYARVKVLGEIDPATKAGVEALAQAKGSEKPEDGAETAKEGAEAGAA